MELAHTPVHFVFKEFITMQTHKQQASFVILDLKTGELLQLFDIYVQKHVLQTYNIYQSQST